MSVVPGYDAVSHPLAGVRVLELTDGPADGIARLFADLGADILKIERPGGGAARVGAPTLAGASVSFALDNANKRSAILDPLDPDDRRRLDELASGADILIGDEFVSAFGTTVAELASGHPELVAAVITDFGTDGPHAWWTATDPVLYAMSTALSRSGPPTGTPVLPPAGIASATAAVQAAWAILVAYYHRLRTGRGGCIDFSRFEAVLQALDPPFGSEGQAASGQKRSTWRGRPRNQQIYPTFRCRDGFVRICLLSPRQWRGMRAWLGEPEEFSDPKFDSIGARYAATRELNAVIADLFARGTMADLVAEGQARGVPIAAVQSPAEALASDHFRAVGALVDAQLAPGTDTVVPVGAFVIDDLHHGFARTAPQPGADRAEWVSARSAVKLPAADRPFDGLRILDLGVIVAGGELGRLFADLGAEVIKVESAAYPDGLRQAPPGRPMSRSWALTHRNESSLGLDLRHPRGAEIFTGLVARSDAVFANFKPGTLAALGFSYQQLTDINARIVLAESSAFGDRGPWSQRMGYGPLVRATTGVTRLWRAPGGSDDELAQFFDATTIFPDHVVARITALATLAALIRRERTGQGAHVHISQAEVAVNQLATAYVIEAARVAGLPVVPDTAVHAVCPCAGEDEWCVISVRHDADRAALAGIVGVEMPTAAPELIAVLSAFTMQRDKHDVAEVLQHSGVPAGPMNRAADILIDPQVRHRGLYTDLVHPLFEEPMPTETGPARYHHIPPAPLRPAPLPGEHTRDICHRVLALDDTAIDRLITDGVLFAGTDPNDPRSSL